MISKPFDIVIIFALISAVIVTVGFGVASLEDQGATISDDEKQLFVITQQQVSNATGFKGTVDDATTAIGTEEGQGGEEDEGNIVTRGYESLKNLYKTYKAVEKIGTEGTGKLPIDPIYWNLAIGCMIIMVFVVIYTWVRGR